MDKRIALKISDEISFPGMDCVIESVVGKGSNAIVYFARYRDNNNTDLFHRVLIKELFPYHPKNLIYRDSEGNIAVDGLAEDYFELQRLSFSRGNSVHLKMIEEHPDRVGGNVNTFSKNGTLYSIMSYDGGRSLDKDYAFFKEDLADRVLLFRQIVGALSIFHDSGYLHLDVSPDNILVISSGENRRVSLIDFNSVHTVGEVSSGVALYSSVKEGYTSPEIINMKLSAIGKSSDIYSLTAVFYWLLTGTALTDYQRLCKKVPDVSNCALLNGVPDTVRSQVSLILRRGLATLPERRYQNCDELLEAVAELQARIEDVGITHSALWDSGVKAIRGIIKGNPALKYLMNPEELYPLRVVSAKGESLNVEAAVDECLKNGSAVLLGQGGMGKTTALLHTAVTRSRGYSPNKTAVLYVSLYGYNGSGENYIKNRILEALRFGNDVSDMEDARRRLIQEFSRTLRTRQGDVPAYLILVDGFNEASGELEGLLREISELSSLKGVRLLISSRSKIEKIGFGVYTMARLETEDIGKQLSQRGLLYPEAPEIRELISIPFMLSVFCNAAQMGEKQLDCKSAAELLEEYINGICIKETENCQEDSPYRWAVEAAVRLVLPYICAEASKKKRLLNERELLKTVSLCYGLVSGRKIASLFPEWTGHSKDIKMEMNNPEEWYSLVITDILWRRTGLLVKEQKGYRVMHQHLQEHLLERYAKINRKVKIRKALFICVSAAIFSTILFMWSFLVRPDTYDEKLTVNYFTGVVDCVAQTGNEIELLSLLADCEEPGMEYTAALSRLEATLSRHGEILENGYSGSYAMALELYERLRETGDVVPWSMEKIDEEGTEKIFALNEEIYESYGTYADVLTFLYGNRELYERYGEEYRKALAEKLAADAQLSDALYSAVLAPHLEELKDKDGKTYSYYIDTLSGFADLSDKDTENPDGAEIGSLLKESEKKKNELEALEIFTIYRREKTR